LRIRDEEDPAVPAPSEIPPDIPLVAKDGPQDDVVDPDEPTYIPPAVPVPPVPLRLGEAPLDLYEKNARLSLMILILFFISLSSYQPATNSSRGRTRVFLTGTKAPPRDCLGGPGRSRPRALDNGSRKARLIVRGTPGTSGLRVKPRARMPPPTTG
jgi:hypothetical protein